jgi:phosphoenolpyruvate synthase/pyruvate phosphate dikinase
LVRGSGLVIAELTEAPAERIGGKALGLARLQRGGLPVPPAVVVPVGETVAADELAAATERLGEPLAVRSSASGEDAGERSAAGQFETLLDVTRAELPAAVQRVRRSATSARAQAYGADAEMAVVIQRQVRATRAGVAFSRDPVTGADEVVLEAVFGYGDALVSGEAAPDRYRVAPDDRVRARVADKGGTTALLRTLRDDEAVEVARHVRRAARLFETPVDVEFCFEGATLWLVQCRPITAL